MCKSSEGDGFCSHHLKENQIVKERTSEKVDLGNSMINILQVVFVSVYNCSHIEQVLLESVALQTLVP